MLFRRTLLYLPTQLAAPLLQFLMAVALTHWLDPAAYGTTMLVIATGEFVYLATLSWWTHYAMRYIASHDGADDRARYQRVENRVLLLGAFAQAFGSIALLMLIDAPWTADLVIVTIAFTILRAVTTHLAERARSTSDVFAYTVLQLAGPGAGLVLARLAFEFLPHDAETVLGSFAAATLLGLLATFRRFDFRGAGAGLDKTMLGTAVRYGLPLLVASAFGWLEGNGIRFLVGHMSGAVALGLFSVAWALGQRLAGVAAMLVTAAAYPLAVQKMTAGDTPGAMAQLSRNGALLFGVVAPAAAGLLMLNSPLVTLLVATEFQEATIALLPLAVLCGMVRNLRIHFVDQAFLVREQPGRLMVLGAGEAIATVVFSTFGLYVGGLAGGIIGAIAAAAAGLVVGYGYAHLRFALRAPLMDMARILFACGAMTWGLSMLPTAQGALAVITTILAGGALYLVALALAYARDVRRLIGLRLAARGAGLPAL